ncbi:MAG: acetylxylan esterase [Acidobacteria bacterium]|nr:acetylxylan esterase [Acidobacteriota bacterium]
MKLNLACLILPCACALAQPPGTNYDESKVPPYKLPPLLVMQNGARVQNAAGWTKRRAEVLALLESQMMGRAPGRPEKLAFELASIDKAALGGKAVRKEVSIQAQGKKFSLLLYLPVQVKGPAPVFVSLGFGPNQGVHPDPGIHLAGMWVQDKETKAIVLRPAQESSRGSAASRWQLETLLARGYGLAVIYYGDIEPDINGGMGQGIRAQYPKPDDAGWGAISAWAWGLSRAVDYLETDKDVDPRRLALVGHSRLGKTALWAGAMDTRFALVISNDSGEGGAAISRRRFGETVANLNDRFPHWFCANYRQYSGKEDAMPFDSHMLLALIAPRPLYVASAQDDQWADPKGEFLINAYDWEQYLEFADRWLKGAH